MQGMFHYFHDKVIPNLLTLMNSPSITKYKGLASLLEDEEISEAKNIPATSKISLSSRRLVFQQQSKLYFEGMF